tara:strand:+ start:17 stop:469 length:453 start_codon:yes stop_codon:yes gene_type:complete
MAHFAQLDDKNIVTKVIVINNDDIIDSTTGVEVEAFGVAVCQKLLGATTNWKQTSYNGNLRGNYAGIGMTYMSGVRTLGVASTDIFIEQQLYPSWTVGINTAQWYSPLGLPPDLTDSEKAAAKYYIWDEDAYQADTNSPKTVGWAITTAS